MIDGGSRTAAQDPDADDIEYCLWLWGGRYDSVWLACQALARTALGERTGDGDPLRRAGPARPCGT